MSFADPVTGEGALQMAFGAELKFAGGLTQAEWEQIETILPAEAKEAAEMAQKAESDLALYTEVRQIMEVAAASISCKEFLKLFKSSTSDPSVTREQ